MMRLLRFTVRNKSCKIVKEKVIQASFAVAPQNTEVLTAKIMVTVHVKCLVDGKGIKFVYICFRGKKQHIGTGTLQFQVSTGSLAMYASQVSGDYYVPTKLRKNFKTKISKNT